MYQAHHRLLDAPVQRTAAAGGIKDAAQQADRTGRSIRDVGAATAARRDGERGDRSGGGPPLVAEVHRPSEHPVRLDPAAQPPTRVKEGHLDHLRSRLAGHRGRNEKGFTLIELLVVVVILGVLIAIAVPLYLNYRKGANDAAAKTDLKNVISALEQCKSDPTGYQIVNFVLVTYAPISPCAGQAINFSAGTGMSYTSPTGISYIVAATNTNGSGKVYCFNSAVAGQIKTVTGALGSAAATC